MKNILLILGILVCNITLNAATILVTNTNDSGPGSLREAVTNANAGDIVRFDNSLLGNGNVTVNLQSRIDINKGIFIKGAYNTSDSVIISGGELTQLFYIYMSSNSILPTVDFDSLVFANGQGAGSYGGAVEIDYHTVEGTVYFRNSIFRNNSADNGGAIGSYRNPAGSPKCKVKVSIHYCTFKSNSATNNGGAIGFHMNSSQSTEPKVEMDIFYSNLINNSSAQKGGAIYAYAYAYNFSTFSPVNATVLLNIEKSSISHNSSSTEGGGIYAIATDNNGGYATLSEVNIKTSTISNNSAVSNGGGIFCHSSDFAHVNLDKASVLYNTTFLDGSAFYLKSDLNVNVQNASAQFESRYSIIAHNNGNANYNNTAHFAGGYHKDFKSNGYNIFNFDYDHFPNLYYPLNWNTEFWNIPANEIVFEPFFINQNGTYTYVPANGNYGIGKGWPEDIEDAQNGPILGARDIGAAESAICAAIPISENKSFCQGSSYDFYGQNLTVAGTFTHTIVTPNACDTLVTLTLSMQTAVTPSVTIASNPGNTIMTGTMVTFTATPVNGGSSPSYQWFINGNPTGPNAPSVQTSGLINNAIVTCTMTSNHACTTTSTDQSNAITFNVHANNDEPCNSITLGVNENCQTEYFANHIATNTTNVGAHTCANSTSKDIWFKFAAPASGNVYIYTYAGTLLDAVMSVYQGNNCSSLFEVGCVDDDGTNQMPQGIVTGATPGQMIYVRVSSYGTTNSGNFGICVVDMSSSNTNPIAANDAFSTTQNTAVVCSILANDSDAESAIDNSSLSIVTPSTNGTAVINANGTITFTPNAGFTGVTTFVYEICDNGSPALCSTGTVTITVGAPANVNPTAANDVSSTAMNTALTISVLSNDFDTDGTLNSSTLDIAIQSNNGTAIVNSNGTITFTPTTGFTGVTTFVYEICDNGSPALCATATVTITVSVVGIEEQSISTRIYPNPVKTILNLESTKEMASYKILTLDGKLVAENNNNDGQIDVQFYSAGIYLLELIAIDGTISRTQFVKE